MSINSFGSMIDLQAFEATSCKFLMGSGVAMISVGSQRSFMYYTYKHKDKDETVGVWYVMKKMQSVNCDAPFTN